MPLSILVAVANRPELRDELADQLTADGHDVHQAHHSRHAMALLAGRQHRRADPRRARAPAVALALLRELRAGTLDPRAWPELPTITLAPLAGATASSTRCAPTRPAATTTCPPAPATCTSAPSSRRSRAARAAPPGACTGSAPIEVDTVAREVRVAGTRVELSAMEFALLSALASDPRRVFTKDELLRDVWGFRAPGRTRTLDSHACRLRRKLAEHGARAVVNVWGVGYRFSDIEPPRP